MIAVTPNATTTIRGKAELATTTETLTGTDAARVVTPDGLAALWEQGGDIASAGTISVGEGGYFTVTGTTTITDIDFGTDKAGRTAWLRFSGALTLTHNATTLILPSGANITTAAGDTACFVSEGSDNVRCVAYSRASGSALVGGSSGVFSHCLYASVTEVVTTAPTAPTVANLVQNSSTADQTNYATANVTFNANRLGLATVASTVTSGTPVQPTATHAGGRTLDVVASVTFGNSRITTFRTMADSGSSAGAITFDFGADTQLRAVWYIDEINNADKEGNYDNGASAIKQQKTASGTGTTGTVTFDSAMESDGSCGYAAFAKDTATEVMSGASGYGVVGVRQDAESLLSGHREFDATAPATNPAMTWATSSAWGGIAIEVRRDPNWTEVPGSTTDPWRYDAERWTSSLKIFAASTGRSGGAATDYHICRLFNRTASARVQTSSQVGSTNSTTSQYAVSTGIALSTLADNDYLYGQVGGRGDAAFNYREFWMEFSAA